MKIAVVTRCLFTGDDKRFEFYKSLYKEYGLKSLKNQTDKEFDSYFIVNNSRRDKVQDIEGVNFIFVNDGIDKIHKFKSRKHFGTYMDVGKRLTESIENKYDVFINMDADCALLPDCIREVRKIIKTKPSVISFNYYLYDVRTHNAYYQKESYNGDACSPIYGVYKSKEQWLYKHGHRKLNKELHSKITFHKPLSLSLCHDLNLSNDEHDKIMLIDENVKLYRKNWRI